MALLPSVPHWFIARKTLPPANLRELIAYMKVNAVTAGSVGAGGSSAVCSYYSRQGNRHDLATCAISRRRSGFAGYRGRNVDTMCDLAANSLAQVKAGNVKAYAVTSKKRWFAAPEVPTVDEAGAPGVELTNWLGAYAPKGTPKDIVATLNKLSTAPWPIRPSVNGSPIRAWRFRPVAAKPEAFAAYLKAEMDKWGAIIRESGIKAQYNRRETQ